MNEKSKIVSFFSAKKTKKKRSSGIFKRERLSERTRAHTEQTEYTADDASSIVVSARVTPGGSLEFTTSGRWISLNFIMTKTHWLKDSGIKQKIREKVRSAISGFDIKIDSFYIVLRYNSKLDDHNTVMMPKYFTDSIKHNWLKNKNGRIMADASGNRIVEFEGVITEDNKDISRGTLLIVDKSLPYNTYILTYVPSDRAVAEIESICKTAQM